MRIWVQSLNMSLTANANFTLQTEIDMHINNDKQKIRWMFHINIMKLKMKPKVELFWFSESMLLFVKTYIYYNSGTSTFFKSGYWTFDWQRWAHTYRLFMCSSSWHLITLTCVQWSYYWISEERCLLMEMIASFSMTQAQDVKRYSYIL